jgi:hypothetical protein
MLSIDTYEETVEDFWDSQDDPTLTNQEDTTVAGTNTCCIDTCPQQAAVTIEQNSYVINEATVTSSVDLGASLMQTATLNIAMMETDGITPLALAAQVTVRLVDSLLNKSTPSPVPPDSTGWSEKDFITDEDGELSVVIAHTGGVKTWYAIVIFGGFVHTEETALAFGV